LEGESREVPRPGDIDPELLSSGDAPPFICRDANHKSHTTAKNDTTNAIPLNICLVREL
jgi:hypothetical protein